MTKTSKGSKCDFYRNSVVNGDNVTIIAEVKKAHPSQVQQFIIENENGWNPDELRKKTYGLDSKKKYLFITEDEAQPTGSNKKRAAEAEEARATRKPAKKGRK